MSDRTSISIVVAARQGLIACLVALGLTFMAPEPSAHAQGAQNGCYFGPLNHTSMSGIYQGDDATFMLNIYPCGGSSELFWTDVYGQNYSQKYQATDTLNGGGWIGRVVNPYATGPWNTSVMGYKPAERGAIQIIFWQPLNEEQLIVRHGIKIR